MGWIRKKKMPRTDIEEKKNRKKGKIEEDEEEEEEDDFDDEEEEEKPKRKSKAKEPAIIEREINLSYLNDKLNGVISILLEMQKKL